MISSAILLMLALFAKHLICDFVYQPPYQWQNKGTYGHWGGIVHSGQHALVSVFILVFVTTLPVAVLLATAEFIAHYHIDWAKMNINKSKGWACNTHEQFWILTGLDQFAHQACYLIMVAIVFM